MRYILTAFSLCLLALAGLPASLAAQRLAPDLGRQQQSFKFPPASPRKCVEIGNFYFHRKDYRGALSRYRQAARENRYYAPAYLGLGRVNEKMGRKREALAYYHRYLNLLPSQWQANHARRVHKAIRRLERQLRREKKNAGARHASLSAAKH